MIYVKPEPCPRPGCGGAIVSGCSDSCILCARPGGNEPLPAPKANGWKKWTRERNGSST